ncbi:MAG: AAA family ATPase [Armatimonas sp.]
MHRRNITHNLKEALGDTPVVLLTGARQTGKTTLARDLAFAPENFPGRYATLDDLEVRSAARADPAGFLATLAASGEPVILDEIQHVPELLPAIKVSVDRDRRPGRFLLTGSANVLVLPKVSESLAGRIEILPLWPLSQAEIAGKEGAAWWTSSSRKNRPQLYPRALRRWTGPIW